jgi:peptidoglycan/LPS O-acetylase OafA/YrhL
VSGPAPSSGPAPVPAPTAAPPDTAVTGHHLPALNGLRALAVLGVMAYHLQLGWASGGYLGVDLFFVLSGFLITSLLLEEWVGTGRLDLVEFWARRAKRLLPALFVVLVALAVYLVLNGRLGGPGGNGLVDLSGLRGDALATLLYVGNWHAIFAHQSYFAQFSTPSPLQHTWSLAIEEQFYLVWPLLLFLILRGARRAWRQVGLATAVAATLLSAGLMALLFHPGGDPTRIYYGTDTRLFDLMAGVTVAFLSAARPQPKPRARRALHLAGPAGAAALAVFWVTAGTSQGVPKNWMFDGGFLLCAVLAAVVVADARLLAQGPFARLLSTPPLHFLGTISYGVYLWHWPIFVYLSAGRTGLGTLPLDLVRLAATLGLATASFYLVERPIRRKRFRGSIRFGLAPLAGVATAAALVIATVPAVADPTPVATTSKTVAHPGAVVTGSGGYAGEKPITLPAGTVVSPAQPLRIMLIGDSVMHDASFALTAAFEATGEATVSTHTVLGFGLTVSKNWPTVFADLISEEHPQLIIGSWSWDNNGPTTPNALYQPAAYTALLRRAVDIMLAPGDGVSGVIFTQFPIAGDVKVPDSSQQARDDKVRTEGTNAWNAIAARMATDYPGRVMFLPVASSLLLDGHYSTWLPPLGDPHAPRKEWIRVRKLDTVHLCPEGAARYAQATLTDLSAILTLPAATPSWTQGAWTTDPDFNDPPGACPDDHP